MTEVEPGDPVWLNSTIRLARLAALAQVTFGDPQKARIWLARSSRALAGEAPLALGASDRGAGRVETLLGRIAHGLAS